LIKGQAPGQKVQDSGIPWDDRSGDELRRWLDVSNDQFYDNSLFALVPMGFCYPGKGTSGDLPPRPECTPLWHNKVLSKMRDIKLTILIGQYSQKYYLGKEFNVNITENIRSFKKFMPDFLPLVHPSPRNRIWQKKNPCFECTVIPFLQQRTNQILEN
jgi:uracil-DNA glycosylase